MVAGARQIATSSVVLLLENVVRLAAVAVVSFWMARQLGPSQFGILNFASALTAILLSVASMGMDTPAILRLTRDRRAGLVLGTVLLVRVCAGIVMCLVAILAGIALKGSETMAITVTAIVAISIVVGAPAIFDYWFKSQTIAAAPAFARVAATLTAVGAKVACLLLGLGLVAFAWTVVLEYFLTGAALAVAYFLAARLRGLDRLGWDRALLVVLVIECWPYMLSIAAIAAFMKIEVVMLGYLSSNAETGIYSLTQKLSEVLYVVPVVLIDSAYPALARRFLDSDTSDSRHGQVLFDLAVGGSFIATIVAMVCAKPVIIGLFGDAYAASVTLFYLHSISCVAIALNTARHRWFAAVGLQRFAPIVTVLGLALNVGMNLVLIPRMGAMGAAVATVVSYFVAGYVSSFLFAQLAGIGLMQTRALWPWGRLYATLGAWRAREGVA